mmetsp:Transcript_102974/g.297774  ORF Transcript_102974/g.297774 Transcript_102974/m.297774 type:complete len:204 (+) Transcript_102974:1331-1942(+)
MAPKRCWRLRALGPRRRAQAGACKRPPRLTTSTCRAACTSWRRRWRMSAHSLVLVPVAIQDRRPNPSWRSRVMRRSRAWAASHARKRARSRNCATWCWRSCKNRRTASRRFELESWQRREAGVWLRAEVWRASWRICVRISARSWMRSRHPSSSSAACRIGALPATALQALRNCSKAGSCVSCTVAGTTWVTRLAADAGKKVP